jgi:hypothetical protein
MSSGRVAGRVVGWMFTVWISCASTARAQKEQIPGNFSSGLNKYINVPLATLDIDDKSRISHGLFWFGDFRYHSQKGDLLQADFTKPLREFVFPKSLLSHTVQWRVSGNQDIAAYDLRYSDSPAAFDVGLQFLYANREPNADVSGLGFSARYEISPARREMVHKIRSFLQKFPKIPEQKGVTLNDFLKPQSREEFANFLKKPEAQTFLNGFFRESDQALSEAIAAFNKAAVSWRTSLILGHRDLHSAGKVTQGGVSVSKLYPLRQGEDSQGMTGVLAVQHVGFRSDGNPRLSDTQVGFVVTWQDQVPKVVRKTPTPEDKAQSPFIEYEYHLKTWSWQMGVEYSLKNDLDGRRSYALFVRHRPREKDVHYDLFDDYPYAEHAFFISKSPNNQWFVGFRVQVSFAFSKQ